MTDLNQHWPAMSRAWEQTGSPLRPCAQDAANYFNAAKGWMDLQGAPRVLLLGVTPEIYRLPWPENRDFLAVDRTPAMIENVWCGQKTEVLQAGWLDLPLPPGSRDIALCDGGLHLLDYPHGQRLLVERLSEVMASGGRVIFRLFTPPAQRELPGTVLEDLCAGRIANLNILKLRLGMALQESAESGVALAQVWRVLHDWVPDTSALADRLGWPRTHMAAIDIYRDSPARYAFSSLEQVDCLFSERGDFVRVSTHLSDYPLGERCPMVVYVRQ